MLAHVNACGVASDTVEKVYLGDTGGALYVIL